MPVQSNDLKGAALVLLGAIVGGVAGFFVFGWALTQGLYAMVVPGGFVGLGAGFGRTRFKWVAVICGVAAFILGLFSEWHFRPFMADDSLNYFLSHLGELTPFTWIAIAVGTALAFWLPFSRGRK